MATYKGEAQSKKKTGSRESDKQRQRFVPQTKKKDGGRRMNKKKGEKPKKYTATNFITR